MRRRKHSSPSERTAKSEMSRSKSDGKAASSLGGFFDPLDFLDFLEMLRDLSAGMNSCGSGGIFVKSPKKQQKIHPRWVSIRRHSH